MEYRQFGNTDLQVRSIGIGCVTFGREIDRKASFEVLDRALDRGIMEKVSSACKCDRGNFWGFARARRPNS
jgi:predicted aldo/keto reductase-like oxidoreductase